MALGLFIAWDGFLRLPSDLLSLTPASLVRPVSREQGQWALLLYPEEGPARSKTGGFDEGLMLRHAACSKLSGWLRRLKERRAASSPLWAFTEKQFLQVFASGVATLKLPVGTIPYQVRHGAASHAALEGEDISSIQRRLRHASPATARRYEKHARYLAEAGKLPSAVKAYGEWVEMNLVPLLLGTMPVISFGHCKRLCGWS